MPRLAPLGRLTPAAFLRRHWQKAPLVVRGAFSAFAPPLTPGDLLTLACRNAVESRLVLKGRGRHDWRLRHGPFTSGGLRRLPPRNWTILVQEADRHVPDVARLLEPFRFLPNWRIDDIMVSLAAPGGGVGPHVDRYDVFLVQGHGRRRWRIGRSRLRSERLIPGLDLSVLEDFHPGREWILGPGDLLYLPPGIAHEGVALTQCMTYSIGCRAPAPALLLASLMQERLGELDADRLDEDPGLRPARRPGEITAAVRRRLRSAVRSALGDDDALDLFLGRALTRPGREPLPRPPARRCSPANLRRRLAAGETLHRVAVPGLAFFERGGRTCLFAGGRGIALPRHLGFCAPLLTGRARLDHRTLAAHLGRPGFTRLLADLVADGHLLLI